MHTAFLSCMQNHHVDLYQACSKMDVGAKWYVPGSHVLLLCLGNMLDPWGLCLCQHCSHPRHHTFGFPSINFEEINQFHWNITEGLSIIEYRSNSNLKIKWPFLIVVFWWIWFQIDNFERDASILFKVWQKDKALSDTGPVCIWGSSAKIWLSICLIV